MCFVFFVFVAVYLVLAFDDTLVLFVTLSPVLKSNEILDAVSPVNSCFNFTAKRQDMQIPVQEEEENPHLHGRNEGREDDVDDAS